MAYAGNAGSGINLMGSTTSQAKADGVLCDRIGFTDSGNTYSGGKYSLDSVTSGDGTSNTLAYSEKCGNIVPSQATYTRTITVNTALDWANAGSYPIFGLPGGSFTDYDGSGTVTTSEPKVINSTSTGAVGILSLPSSPHPSGVMAAFCDGHVQFIRDNITPYVYAQLITSDSKYNSGFYSTNSPRADYWLKRAPAPAPPYLLSEDEYR
jgi:prepilin-type processing-associated H-X9-DG protein